MPVPPVRPKLYHITHVDNLASIVEANGLHADAMMIARGGPKSPIGMSTIKKRRLSLPVACHDGDTVGEYVPFYFCPRSIMLFVLHRGNSVDLSYQGGQGPIVHLQADLRDAVAWAEMERRRWCFTLSNAGAAYAEFRTSLDALADVNWPAVEATDFRDPTTKEGKQAEFLLHSFFPWSLVTGIGVHSNLTKVTAETAIRASRHRPAVTVQPTWYF